MKIKDTNQINTQTAEGRYLMAALVKLSWEYGGKTHNEILGELGELVRAIFPPDTDDYENEKQIGG